MSKQAIEVIAIKQIEKKLARFESDVKEILDAVETHHVLSYESIPTNAHQYNKLLLDDIAFVGKTVDKLKYTLRDFNVPSLRNREEQLRCLNHAYDIAYIQYKNEFRFNPNDIDTYLDKSQYDHSSAYLKAKGVDQQ